MNRKFDFDDILLMPSTISTIESRYSDINPKYDTRDTLRYPLFAAPMDTVIDENNIYEFSNTGINVCIPRTVKNQFDLETPPVTFKSYSLQEFTKAVENFDDLPSHVLIDVANGHMAAIPKICKTAKRKYTNLKIMVGNIANPETYRIYAEAKCVDYIRVGIGNGGGCLTTKQTSIGYPKASLIYDIKRIKEELEYKNLIRNTKLPKIVADGGMKDYSDVIKALALGADYVMLGSILNKAFESAGAFYTKNIVTGGYIELTDKQAVKKIFDSNKVVDLYKMFRGMSTKEAQRAMGKSEDQLKTSEGVVRYRPVEYYLKDWIENFDHYLRSAMSYCNARTLDEFIGHAEFNFITESAYRRFDK